MEITLYCTPWCRDCRMTKEFLEANGLAYAEINIDQDAKAETELIARVGKRAIPQMVIDGAWFQPYRPGQGLLYDELRQRLGLKTA